MTDVAAGTDRRPAAPRTEPADGAHVDPRIERTRRLVVAAAAELLAEEGIERITIDGIAERSGVARSTIYRHWPDRADLFAEAFSVVCSVPPAVDDGSLVADLRDKATNLADGLTNAPWGRMLASVVGAADHDDDLRRALASFNRQRRAEAIAVVQRAVDRGEVGPGHDLPAAVERFIAPFFLRRLMSGDPLDDEFVERQLRMICAELDAPYDEPG